MKIERQSQIELLRCLLMLMLLILHFNGLALGIPSTERLHSGNLLFPILQLSIENLTIIVVNCFVLISGYFGISFKISKLGSLFFQCLFFNLLSLGILVACDVEILTVKSLLYSILAFSRSSLWFVPTYVALVCMSPMLNCFVKKAVKKDFLLTLVLLTFLNVYIGWLMKREINPVGYNIMQFIYLYYIGRYLSIWGNVQKMRVCSKFLLIGYLSISVVNTILSTAFIYYLNEEKVWSYILAYNNPLNIISAVCLLLYFMTLEIKNKFINWVGASAFSVYLFHMCLWKLIYPMVRKGVETLSSINVLIGIAVAILLLYVISILLDKFRILLYALFIRIMRRFIINCLKVSLIDKMISSVKKKVQNFYE